MARFSVVVCVFGMSLCPGPARAQELRSQAAGTLRKATDFFRQQVSTEGGYLWRYSEDLSRREGEGTATASMVWVQPPGTPSVGLAYLSVYELTGEEYYLEAARETADALVRGQLRSGGWNYSIEFDPQKRRREAYRVDPERPDARNVSTLDDNTTQEAVRLLMHVDRTLSFRDEKVHEAAQFALSSLLEAQYPNGAWPQRYDRFADPTEHPIRQASYPESWSRTFPGINYRGYYTFNDNAMGDMVDIMLEASRIYGQPRYREAAERAGGFMLLAQMPEPQPAWAQQYDRNMHPAWARKFEPPSVTGGESHGVMRTLLQLFRETGNRRYLEPIPRAIAYLRSSQLPDGRLARFYELKTNRPIYFTKDYRLTYSDRDMPTHYGFKTGNNLARIAREYERLRNMDRSELGRRPRPSRPVSSPGLVSQTKAIIAGLDARGAWVEQGRLRDQGTGEATEGVISSRTFSANVRTLSRYLAATDR